MFAAVLGRLEERGHGLIGDKVPPFSDVDGAKYYAKYIAWAKEKGIIAGDGGNMFKPERQITREEMALILYNYLNYSSNDIQLQHVNIGKFVDRSSVSSWAVTAVDTMYSYGIINGLLNNTFAPKGTATRAEIAKVLYNFTNH